MTSIPVPGSSTSSQRNPGDEVTTQATQTAENTCPECQGSGKKADQSLCQNCGGTGIVIVTVGDA